MLDSTGTICMFGMAVKYAGLSKFGICILALVGLLVFAGLPSACAEQFVVSTDPAIEAMAAAGERIVFEESADTARIEEVKVTGQGASRQLALRNAFREAIEQRLGVLVVGRTTMVDLAVAADKVVASSQGFIEGYEVLSEEVDSNGLHTVTALVHISADSAANRRLLAAVGLNENADKLTNQALVRANLNDPRVAVSFSGEPWAAARLMELFKSAGFSRVTLGTASDMKVTGYFDGMSCHLSHSWGFESDFVASVTCHLSLPDKIGDRAFSTVRTGSAWSPNGREALQLAKEQALELVAADLASWLKDRVRTTEQHLRVHVNLPPEKAQAWLESVPLVNRVYVRHFGTDGYTTMEADADCSAEELIYTLESMGISARDMSGDVLVTMAR